MSAGGRIFYAVVEKGKGMSWRPYRDRGGIQPPPRLLRLDERGLDAVEASADAARNCDDIGALLNVQSRQDQG
jgi:hypothetical protein